VELLTNLIFNNNSCLCIAQSYGHSEGAHVYCEKYGTKSLSRHRQFYVVFEQSARDFYSVCFCVGANVLYAFLLSVTVCF